MTSNQQSTEQLRAEISHTRAELDETIDELKEQLNPDRLKAEARKQVREKTETAKREIREHPRSTIMKLRHTVRRTIREHPLPTALVGAGVAWLFSKGVRGSGKNMVLVAYRDLPDEVVAAMKRGEHTRDARAGLLERHTLSAITTAVAVGVLIGRLFPDTKREQQLRGQHPDEFVDKMKAATESAVAQAQQVVDQARLKAQLGRQEARDVADDVQSQTAQAKARTEGAAESVRHKAEDAREQASVATDEVKRKIHEDTGRDAKTLMDEARHNEKDSR